MAEFANLFAVMSLLLLQKLIFPSVMLLSDFHVFASA